MKDELKELVETLRPFITADIVLSYKGKVAERPGFIVNCSMTQLSELAHAYQAAKQALEPEDIFKPGNVLVALPVFSALNSYTYFVLVARDDNPSDGYFKGVVLATGDPEWEPGDFRVTWAKEAKLWRTPSLEEAAQYQRKNMTGETIRGPEVKLDKW